MSYRNPQIVQPSKAGEIYAAAIGNFGKQVAGTIQAFGDKKRAEEKAANAEAEVNRQIYNKIDIENAEMQADMTQKIKDFQLRDQLAPILTQAIEGYGDAKIALLTEKNTEMRAFYKKEMQKSYATMMDAKTFTESIQGDVGRYSTIKNGADFGSTVGIAGNEIDTQATNQMFLAAISGKLPNSNISMQLNENGGIDLTAFADGKPIRTVNSTKYGQSGNELIFDAPDTITEMQKELDAQIKNDAGGLSSDFISDPEIRRFATGKDNFQQQINRIDVNGIINKGTDVFKGQAAAFDAMSNQRKAFVWRNQLKQNTGYEGALNATPEQIAQAYKDVARTELLKEAKIDSAEINGETVYFQGSKPQLVTFKEPTVSKLTEGEKKEKRRFENLSETEEDINLLFQKLPVKRNSAGLYIGKVDMNDIGIQDKIINSGFSVSSVTAKQTQEEKDNDEEPQIIGYKLKPEGKASTAAFEVLLNVTPQKLMEKMLLSKGATAKEAKEKSYTAGFIPPNVEEDKYSQYKQE